MRRTRLFYIIGATGALLCSTALTAYGQRQSSAPAVHPFIVGGVPVHNLSETPGQVALVQGAGGNLFQFCGGTLIAPNWVITAAHCVDNFMVRKDPTRFDVIAGTLNYKMGGVRSKVDKMFVHPKWGQSGTQYDYDGTLLKLSMSMTGIDTLKPTAPSGALPAGINVQVSGWGALSESGPVSEQLLKVQVPVVGSDECNKPESYDGGITDRMFCAGAREGGLDSCQGDSGGPVMSGDRELVGIVSWGEGCARRLKPGVYTRVSAISQWASDTMSGN